MGEVKLIVGSLLQTSTQVLLELIQSPELSQHQSGQLQVLQVELRARAEARADLGPKAVMTTALHPKAPLFRSLR